MIGMEGHSDNSSLLQRGLFLLIRERGHFLEIFKIQVDDIILH